MPIRLHSDLNEKKEERMSTMVDEIYDRHYQEARANLNGGIASVFSQIGRVLGDSFRAQHRIEWSAPWAAKSKRT